MSYSETIDSHHYIRLRRIQNNEYYVSHLWKPQTRLRVNCKRIGHARRPIIFGTHSKTMVQCERCPDFRGLSVNGEYVRCLVTVGEAP